MVPDLEFELKKSLKVTDDLISVTVICDFLLCSIVIIFLTVVIYKI
jgi:hypothetical protein